MNVLHVVPSFPPAYRYGGPVAAAHAMAKHLGQGGVDVTVYTTDIDGDENLEVPTGEPTTQDGVDVVYHRARSPRAFTFSPALASALRDDVASYDLVHVHSVLNHPTTAAARACRSEDVPYLVRPCGILDRTAFRKPYEDGFAAWLSRLRKWSYLHLVESSNLETAAAIHYTSEAEREASRWALDGHEGFVLPLGVDPPDLPDRGKARARVAKRWNADPAVPWMLYLSRIDPVKGLDLLLPALEEIESEAILLLAGSGDPDYESTVDERIERLGLRGRVIRTGFVTGDAKRHLLAASDLFTLPSVHENFGIAAVEALSAGLPVVLTSGVAVHDAVQEAKAGLVPDRTVSSIAEALSTLATRENLRQRMGENARALARERYNWERIAADLVDQYERILEGSG